MIREILADLCHRQWSGWMKYLFSKGTFNEDGTWTMPSWAVERWKRQMETPYAQLSESEQESDRTEAEIEHGEKLESLALEYLEKV